MNKPRKQAKTQLSEYGVSCRPCPFCGYRYKGLSIVGPGNSRFECAECGALGPFPEKATKGPKLAPDRAAIIAWNRRV